MTVYIREYKDVLGRDIKKGDTVTWLEDNVSYSIYAPKGTRYIYAEPQSYYGGTI